MISMPTFAIKAGNYICKFAIKHGPKIMAGAGAVSVVGGTVLACQATLKADAIIEQHHAQMEKIKYAQSISDEYTKQDMIKDKTQVYISTAIKFAKLYGPAIALEISGIACMLGAFGIMSKRFSTAMTALTTLDQQFQDYRKRVEQTDILDHMAEPNRSEVDHVELPWDEEDSKEEKTMIIDPNKETDPFVFYYDSNTPGWYDGAGWVLNSNRIMETIKHMQLDIASGAKSYYFLNDVLKRLEIPETKIGHFYGWTNKPGDNIDVEVTPYIYQYTGEDAKQFPLMIPVTLKEIRQYELDDVTDGYGFEIRFKSAAGVGGQPRMIAEEVFGC